MKKEKMMNLAGILLLYIIIILGVIALNERMEYINQNTNNIMVGR